MHKPLHKFIKKYPQDKRYSQTYERSKDEIANTWNGKAPIEDEIKKPTD